MQLLKRQGDRVTSWLALTGAFSPLTLIGPGLAAGLLTPGYSPANETISQLSSPGAPFPQIISAGFLAYALLVTSVAWALRRFLGQNLRSAIIAFLLLAYAGGFAIAGLFRTDSNYVTALGITEDTVHLNAARMAFVGIILTTLAVAVTVWHWPGWRGFAVMSVASSIMCIVLGALFVGLKAPGMTGTTELALMLVAVGWVEMLGLRLYRHSRQSEQSGLTLAEPVSELRLVPQPQDLRRRRWQ